MSIRRVRVQETHYCDYTVHADTDDEARQKVLLLREEGVGLDSLEYSHTAPQGAWAVVEVAFSSPEDVANASYEADQNEKQLRLCGR